AGDHCDYPLDTLMRFEVQDRRRERLRAIHHQGYAAHAVRGELQRTVAQLGALSHRDLRSMIAGESASTIARTLGMLYLVEHEEAWPIVRSEISRRTYYRWKQHSRELALGSADWSPTIPDDA